MNLGLWDAPIDIPGILKKEATQLSVHIGKRIYGQSRVVSWLYLKDQTTRA